MPVSDFLIALAVLSCIFVPLFFVIFVQCRRHNARVAELDAKIAAEARKASRREDDRLDAEMAKILRGYTRARYVPQVPGFYFLKLAERGYEDAIPDGTPDAILRGCVVLVSEGRWCNRLEIWGPWREAIHVDQLYAPDYEWGARIPDELCRPFSPPAP